MRLMLCCYIGVGMLPACTAIEGERILARDLAREVPAFSVIEPGTDLGPSPSPGVKRVLSRTHLLRLISTQGKGFASMPESLCVERALTQLGSDAVEGALRNSAREIFPNREVRLEVLDYSRYPLPLGNLRFQRQGVLGGSGGFIDAAILWRGSLLTGSGRSIPIWARAKFLVERSCWRVRVPHAAGDQPVGDQFERIELWVNPFSAAADCVDPNQKNVRLRRTLHQDQLLVRSDLTVAPPVRRGAKVQASVTVASARISVDAIAEMDGTPGQSIFVKREGRRLRARVVSAGAVEILPRDHQ